MTHCLTGIVKSLFLSHEEHILKRCVSLPIRQDTPCSWESLTRCPNQRASVKGGGEGWGHFRGQSLVRSGRTGITSGLGGPGTPRVPSRDRTDTHRSTWTFIPTSPPGLRPIRDLHRREEESTGGGREQFLRESLQVSDWKIPKEYRESFVAP